ncbi:mechanosensitive ion channel family protein [Telluribacter sp.]|jgi:MscS family membrane protein|uniref:mechanosensitive ion channel family protein n=1 Tax=Telluribacter sp. TaxID=1978767 RepID=UPI002E13228B|nr:mechanosensitive ion channel family protein [Telluribacter sp.]
MKLDLVEINRWLRQEIWRNSIEDYLWALGILVVGFFIKRAVSRIMSKWVFRMVRKESEGVPLSEFLRLIRPPVEFLLILLIVYLAFEQLKVPEIWPWLNVRKTALRVFIDKLYQVVFIIGMAWAGVRIIKYVGLVFIRKAEKTESRVDDQLVPFFRDLTILLFVIAICFIVLGKVFEVDVLTLVTSLGIGGLALALAARETLENLFASFALMLDRPFTLGDSINVGGTEGTIETIGFRSTRLRTFDGSLVTIPNRLLTSQTLDNLTERRLRRARYYIGLAYDTPSEALQAIVAEIQTTLNEHEKTRQEPGVVRFDKFGESSLDLLIIFYVLTQDIKEFNQVKEEINLAIIKIVEKHGARFAFPARELYIRNEYTPSISADTENKKGF